MPTTEEYLHQSSSVRGDGCSWDIAWRHRQIRVSGVWRGSRGLVINVPSPYLVVPPTANMYSPAAGEKVAGCALPSESKGC